MNSIKKNSQCYADGPNLHRISIRREGTAENPTKWSQYLKIDKRFL